MYFWTYGLQKTCLDKSLKGPVSKDPLTSKMVNGSKHCSKFGDSTFTIFIDACEGHSGLKSISEWYAKSSDCFLTHSLPIISMLFLEEAIYWNIFRSDYFKNKKYFLIFFPFSKFRFNFEIFQKVDDTHSLYKWLNKCLNNPV